MRYELNQTRTCHSMLGIHLALHIWEQQIRYKVHWAKFLNRHSSKSIWVIKLCVCQNDSPMGESFWQKHSLITYILFELCTIWESTQSQFCCHRLYVLYVLHCTYIKIFYIENSDILVIARVIFYYFKEKEKSCLVLLK